MADADKSLKLTIETASDPQPINAVQAALEKLDKAVEASKDHAPGAAEGLYKVADAAKKLDENAAVVVPKVEALGEGHEKLGPAGDKAGEGLRKAGAAAEIMKDGVGGLAENLPGLLSGLGIGGGLAGVLGLVVTGLVTLYKHLDDAEEKTVTLTGKLAEEMDKVGEAAVETAKKEEADRQAKDASELLAEAIYKNEAALQAEMDAIKKSLEEMKLLSEEKRKVAAANKELALAQVDADSSLSPADKLRRKNEINNDYSEASQKEEQKLYEAQAKAAEQQAVVAAKEAEEKRQLAKKAREAEETARANAEAATKAKKAGGQGKDAFADLAEGLKEDKGNLLGEKPVTEGLPEVKEGESHSKQAAEVARRLAERLKKLNDIKDSNAGADTPALDPAISATENSLKKAQIAQELLEQGDMEKGLRERQDGMDGTAKAYGSPEKAEAEAEKADQAGADFKRKADQTRRSAGTSREVYKINQKRATVTGDAAVRDAEARAKEEEERKAEQEARQAEAEQRRQERGGEKHDSDLNRVRDLARRVAPNAGTMGRALNKAANSGTEAELIKIVNQLADALAKTRNEVPPGVRAEIAALNQKVAALRRTTDRPSQ